MVSIYCFAEQTVAQQRYIGRFAPSPSGALHLGSLVAAMASYIDARAANGTWLLRIENVDSPRCSSDAEREILRQLSAYGFIADGEIWRQSERAHIYEAALAKLREHAHLFACNCTRRSLDSNPEQRRNSEGEIIYPGTCRNRPNTGSPAYALRVRAAPTIIAFTDRAYGHVEQNIADDVGDFIVKRADALYAYQIAVVIDDAAQGITDVVRGADLLLNTPRQIYLQHLLGYAQPRYLHLPLVRNEIGEKLSKQTQAPAIATDNILPTLHAAWSLLKQPPLGRVDNIATFWQLAYQHWSAKRCAVNYQTVT